MISRSNVVITRKFSPLKIIPYKFRCMFETIYTRILIIFFASVNSINVSLKIPFARNLLLTYATHIRSFHTDQQNDTGYLKDLIKNIQFE